MTTDTPKTDKQRLEEIRKSIVETGSKESSFIRIEQLFYEAINIARNHGKGSGNNRLLEQFKQLEESEYYQKTKAHFRKSSQREQAIKRFINQFKILLSTAIKDHFASPVTGSAN